MLCSFEPIDTDEINEHEDIYPCKNCKCNKYHKSGDKYAGLSDAIYYLKPKRVEELIKQFDEHEITNTKLYSNFYTNLLHSTISRISGTSGMGLGVPTITKIGTDGFRNSLNGRYPNQIAGSGLFLEIIEIICNKFPWMINSKCYTIPHYYSIDPILDILNKYRVSNNEEKTCLICSSPYPEELIAKPCGCVDKHIHIECLGNEISNTPKLNGESCCRDCGYMYNCYKCPKGRISFPKLNIYQSPLTNVYIQIDPDDKCEQLRFACAYLCVDIIWELLESFTKEEFEEIIEKIFSQNKYSGAFIKYKNFMMLDPNPFTNLQQRIYGELFNQINQMLITKQIDYMDYKCANQIQMSWGKYLWCGQTGSPTGSGFTLVNSTSTSTDSYGSPYTYFMNLTLNPNEKLLRDCEFYDIYTNTGFLFGYNIGGLKSNIQVFKKINPELIGTELEIVFSKRKQLTGEEQERLKSTFSRIPKVPVYSFNISIPQLHQYGETSDCAICLDSVNNETNKYISPCGHLFHLDCIFKYLESKNLLYPVYPRCVERCCGAKKIKPFECAVCKTIITK